ncbi:hypothetical protein MCY_01438 [Bartonella rattimassiliensis 15908]|uniref:Uncharacterized protein n=1 Tax=Bartonella rattimassiliensis 15908 TaxID=1094556 RepID=J0QHC6_9HYPH|nr:hypothetical protein MCY_01438 [Bartonella rattimassiliensis 15908]
MSYIIQKIFRDILLQQYCEMDVKAGIFFYNENEKDNGVFGGRDLKRMMLYSPPVPNVGVFAFERVYKRYFIVFSVVFLFHILFFYL